MWAKKERNAARDCLQAMNNADTHYIQALFPQHRLISCLSFRRSNPTLQRYLYVICEEPPSDGEIKILERAADHPISPTCSTPREVRNGETGHFRRSPRISGYRVDQKPLNLNWVLSDDNEKSEPTCRSDAPSAVHVKDQWCVAQKDHDQYQKWYWSSGKGCKIQHLLSPTSMQRNIYSALPTRFYMIAKKRGTSEPSGRSKDIRI